MKIKTLEVITEWFQVRYSGRTFLNVRIKTWTTCFCLRGDQKTVLGRPHFPCVDDQWVEVWKRILIPSGSKTTIRIQKKAGKWRGNRGKKKLRHSPHGYFLFIICYFFVSIRHVYYFQLTDLTPFDGRIYPNTQGE